MVRDLAGCYLYSAVRLKSLPIANCQLPIDFTIDPQNIHDLK
jgi:hypothetical protein